MNLSCLKYRHSMNFQKPVDKQKFVCYNMGTAETNNNSNENGYKSEQMETYEENDLYDRTNIKSFPQESGTVWEQLLRLAESGDIRAIKLYYDMLEKKQRPASGTSAGTAPDIEPMAAIRRAVFGDAAIDAAARDAVRCGQEVVRSAEDEEEVDGF